jgi:hypothetical protein
VSSGKVAGVQETDAATPATDSSARRMASVPADRLMLKATTGGVAHGTEARASVPPLRRVRSDSTRVSNRTVFEVSPGVEVTLTDAPVAAFDSRMKQRVATGTAAAAPVQPPQTASSAQRDEAKPAPINTISWIDKRGHSMTLAGPLPREQLELLRQRLPEDQR